MIYMYTLFIQLIIMYDMLQCSIHRYSLHYYVYHSSHSRLSYWRINLPNSPPTLQGFGSCLNKGWASVYNTKQATSKLCMITRCNRWPMEFAAVRMIPCEPAQTPM